MRTVALATLAALVSLSSPGLAATKAITDGAVMIVTTKKSCPMKVGKPVVDAGIGAFAKDRGLQPQAAARILDKAAVDLTTRLRKAGKLKAFCATSETILTQKLKQIHQP